MKKDIKWTKEEDEIIKKYGICLTREELWKQYFPYRTKDSVRGRCSYLHISRQRDLINETQRAWNDYELSFLKNNYKILNKKDIAEKLNRTPSAVQNKLNKLGLKQDKKYYFNSNVFENIDSDEKAYWIGFIYADGCVQYNTDNNYYELSIQIALRDIEHLKKFNKFLNGNLKIKSYQKDRYDKTLDTCVIRVYSKDMVEDLMKYGIIPNKTYKTIGKNILTQIPDEYKIGFIRGYLDGDGWVSIAKRNKNLEYMNLGICSINKTILDEIRNYLYQNYNIKSTINKSNNNEFPLWDLNFRGKVNGVNFGKLLYLNSNIYLDRKYNKFMNFITKHCLLN